jgi:DNA modification methylase
MVKFLKQAGSETKIELHFKDALEIDYSKFNYDMVLTSPPYYNLEFYGGEYKPMPKEEWNIQFYEPLLERTYKFLKPGGHYCLNISREIYDSVAKKVLGACKIKIAMKKFKRTTGNQKDEYIYIWKK